MTRSELFGKKNFAPRESRAVYWLAPRLGMREVGVSRRGPIEKNSAVFSAFLFYREEFCYFQEAKLFHCIFLKTCAVIVWIHSAVVLKSVHPWPVPIQRANAHGHVSCTSDIKHTYYALFIANQLAIACAWGPPANRLLTSTHIVLAGFSVVIMKS